MRVRDKGECGRDIGRRREKKKGGEGGLEVRRWRRRKRWGENKVEGEVRKKQVWRRQSEIDEVRTKWKEGGREKRE